jgi:hypothetical protein
VRTQIGDLREANSRLDELSYLLRRLILNFTLHSLNVGSLLIKLLHRLEILQYIPLNITKISMWPFEYDIIIMFCRISKLRKLLI